MTLYDVGDKNKGTAGSQSFRKTWEKDLRLTTALLYSSIRKITQARTPAEHTGLEKLVGMVECKSTKRGSTRTIQGNYHVPLAFWIKPSHDCVFAKGSDRPNDEILELA